MTGPSGSDPMAIVTDQQRRFAALRARAEGARARLADNQATAASPDGAVTVTVNAGGQLEQLRFGARADARTATQLADVIMKTYRTACAEAAARTIDILADISGEDSVTVRGLKDSLPAGVADEVTEIRRAEGRTD
jgi:DNA-binding protein YbaB